MTLVAGVDSSTQSCKVVVRDAATGAVVRTGRAPHPNGTEADPELWWQALLVAIADAGGLEDVAALAVAGQQHGMVALDATGRPVRAALLWNDTRSAGAAAELVRTLGAEAWAEGVGTVPVASFTATKLRWLRQSEPALADQVAAVALPHDYLTWRLAGSGPDQPDLDRLTTDRSDASGTAYWSPAAGEYRLDLLELAFGGAPTLPRVLRPQERAGVTGVGIPGVPAGIPLGAGAGDNAGAALGLGAAEGDVIVSVGTSGTVFAVTDHPTADATGVVAGFADATGRYLPLTATLNAARVLTAGATVLGVDHDTLARLALDAPPGAGGLVLLPYLEGERTPNLPEATGSLQGLTLATATPAHLARGMVEGMLCGLADGLDAITALGVAVDRVLLIGGGAKNEAVRRIAPEIFGLPVEVPPPAEYVAAGAARQAVWALDGELPTWTVSDGERYVADPRPTTRDRYAEAQRALGYREQ